MRALKLLRTVLLSMLVVGLLAASGTILYRHQQGDHVLSVQSGSMVPTFRRGDAVITKRTALSQLRLGDVISYRNPAEPRVLVSHRLVQIDYTTGRLVTKGDANYAPDIAVPYNNVVGVVYEVIPGLGTVIDWLHQPVGLIIAVYIPATLLLLSEIKRLNHYYAQQYHVYRHVLHR